MKNEHGSLHWYEQEKNDLQRVENGVISDFDYHMEILEDHYQSDLDDHIERFYSEQYFDAGSESGYESGIEAGIDHARENMQANDDGEWFFDKWKELSLLNQGRIADMFGMSVAHLESKFHDAMERQV